MLDQSFEYKRLWTDLYEEKGLEAVREEVAKSTLDYRSVGETLIEKIEEKERHTKTLELAEEANQIAEKSLLKARRANTISSISIGVAVIALLVAILKN